MFGLFLWTLLAGGFDRSIRFLFSFILTFDFLFEQRLFLIFIAVGVSFLLCLVADFACQDRQTP